MTVLANIKAKTSYKDITKPLTTHTQLRKLQLVLKWQNPLSRTLKADEFEFVLKNDGDGSSSKVKNTADGKVVFAPIEYTKAGTYKYTIVETNAGQTIDRCNIR